jgi:hypothetical protein
LSGVHINTTESVVLSLAGDSGHPDFKELQKIIRETVKRSTMTCQHGLQHLTPEINVVKHTAP